MRSALTRTLAENKRLRASTSILTASVAAALTPPPALTLPPMPVKQGKKPSEEIALLHLSDTQIGKVTRSYNSEVAVERVLAFFRKCIHITNIRREGAVIKEVHLALGGDMVEGEQIFAHQPHLIDQCVFDQACSTTPQVIAQGIILLLNSFEKVKVICVPGNHGRSGAKHSTAHPRSNWDNVVYATLRSLFFGPPGAERKDPALKRLEIVVAEDFFVVDRIYDWGLLFVHGDQINGGFGGFPTGGTAKKLGGWADSVEEPWDYLYFGHFHTYYSGTINHRQFFCNGTTESDNTFALEALAATGYPTQRLQFFSKDYGVIADMPIYLAEKRRPQRHRYSS